MNVRQLALAVVVALAAGGTAVAQVAAPGAAVTPPPPPSPAIGGGQASPGAVIVGTPAPRTSAPSASPSPSAAPRGRGRATPSPQPSASATPAPPQFSSLDGVWEVQVQPLDASPTIYSHLYVTQKGNDLSGTWARTDKGRDTFTGTFDGRLFALTVKEGSQTLTMTGYAENFSDMVGLLKSADPKDQGTPFTAAHRKKERPY